MPVETAGAEGTSREYTDLREAGTRVEPRRVVPQQFALARLGHIPAEDDAGRLREMALGVRVIRGIHQHVLAEQVAYRVGDRGALRDLDALEIAPARHIVARALLQRRQGRLDRFGMLVEPLDPEGQPAMPG